ncbi:MULTISPECIES: DUF2382 domain-containing protein [unclassified Geodermatophilus]|uniref:DUF2382 domain-containing protein n=1 Tax=unclassified Geodermatophilus TaxID=2637632 RepID=UPI003EEA6FB6
MITDQDVRRVIGSTAYATDGSKLGTVGEVFLDDETGRPEWASVRTGLFGTKEAFVPLAQAELAGEDLRVPFDKDRVKNAPHVDVASGHLSATEESELYRHYGIGDTGTPAAGGRDVDGDGVVDHPVGHDTSGPTTDDAMTRSEERLTVGTRTEEVGRARLRKYVVTENVTETVPVSREEVRVEREPITEGNVGNAMDGPAISEEEHEVTLHAERPVVAKEAVPVERVRLDTETVTEQQTVSEQVREERIEADGVEETRRH